MNAVHRNSLADDLKQSRAEGDYFRRTASDAADTLIDLLKSDNFDLGERKTDELVNLLVAWQCDNDPSFQAAFDDIFGGEPF